MNDLVPRMEKPQLPVKWDYQKSVKKVKAFVYKWKTLTDELACELWIAREKLSAQGARTDLTSGQKSRSWSQYCEDIGSSRRVANRWLSRWFPEIGDDSKAKGELPSGNYSVIYADPPWQYDFSKSDSRQIENQYRTMTAEQIEEIAIPTISNAVLYLWVPSPKLPQGMSVMAAWGFEYKTSLVWDKEVIGMGYWFRNQHELLLLGVKGSPSVPAESIRVSSVLRSKRGRHSKKPDIVRDWIKQWHPRAKAIEMFAREEHKGWTIWGNEV